MYGFADVDGVGPDLYGQRNLDNHLASMDADVNPFLLLVTDLRTSSATYSEVFRSLFLLDTQSDT